MLEHCLHAVTRDPERGGHCAAGDMSGPDIPSAMRCCWTCASLVGGPATECPVCRGKSFLRLYTASFTGRRWGDMSCLPDAVVRLALSLPDPLAALFLRRLQGWVQGVRTAYARAVDRSHFQVTPLMFTGDRPLMFCGPLFLVFACTMTSCSTVIQVGHSGCNHSRVHCLSQSCLCIVPYVVDRHRWMLW